MIWPFMPDHFQRTQLFESLGTGQPDYLVHRWQEYQSDVPRLRPEDALVIDRAAVEILASFETQFPVCAVLVQGHADVALRIAAQQRAEFEDKISQARAVHVAEALMISLTNKRGSLGEFGRNMLDLMFWDTEFFGSRRRVNTHPNNETEMSMNRRAEIFVARTVAPSAERLIICPHGGNIMRITRDGFLPKASDTWVVVGCPFATTLPSPCLQVMWVVTSPDGSIDTTSVGICIGANGPQGSALIIT